LARRGGLVKVQIPVGFGKGFCLPLLQASQALSRAGLTDNESTLDLRRPVLPK
jgi:hypothetical protein